MFEANKIQFPILVSRNFCLLVDAKSSQIWEKLGFSPLDYFLDKEKLIGRFVRNQSDEFNGFEEEQLALNMLYSKLSQRANSIDFTLVTMVNAELEKAKNGVKNIEAKIIRAGKAKHETQLNQVKKIKEKLFPYGELQERTDSFIPHYIQKGDFFFHQLMSHFSPFEKNFLILEDR